MSMILLLCAILAEVAGTTLLKLSQGLTKLVPSLLMIPCYAVSFLFLSLVLKRLDVGLVYAVWSGVGTALIASSGIVWFKEPLTAVKIGSFALSILGVVGLNLSGARWKASRSADLSRFDTRLVSHTCHPRGFLTCTPNALRKRGRGISMSVYYRGKRAQSYDQRYQHFTACTLSETLALLNVEAIAEQAQQDRRVPRLLDVACGTGVLLSLLHERFPTAELTGIDSSQDMLAQAQARLCGIAHLRLAQVVIGPDAQAGVPYPSDSFELITCTNALNAMPNPVATLADLHRLLVPGGHLLLEDIAWRLPHFLWGLSTWLARQVGAGSLHPSTQAEARSLCEQAGFSIRASHAFVTDWLWHGWVIHSVKNEVGGRS